MRSRVEADPPLGVFAQRVSQDEAQDNQQDNGPAQPVLRQQRSDMRPAPFQVGPRSEYLLSYQRMVGGQEHERNSLGVRRPGDLVGPYPPLGLQEEQHLRPELPRYDGLGCPL